MWMFVILSSGVYVNGFVLLLNLAQHWGGWSSRHDCQPFRATPGNCATKLASVLSRQSAQLVKSFASRVERFVFQVYVAFRYSQYEIRFVLLVACSPALEFRPCRHDCERVPSIRERVVSVPDADVSQACGFVRSLSVHLRLLLNEMTHLVLFRRIVLNVNA